MASVAHGYGAFPSFGLTDDEQAVMQLDERFVGGLGAFEGVLEKQATGEGTQPDLRIVSSGLDANVIFPRLDELSERSLGRIRAFKMHIFNQGDNVSIDFLAKKAPLLNQRGDLVEPGYDFALLIGRWERQSDIEETFRSKSILTARASR